MSIELPIEIARVFTSYKTPEATFSELIPVLGRYLECDRCFLYLRDPQTAFGKVEFCWVRDDTIPKIYDREWKQEPKSLASEDPLFAAALRTERSIFVDDVRTARPEVLNRSFEDRSFGHRSLIHAHLCFDNQLWGVLQPCVFNSPRYWGEKDKQIIDRIVSNITPLAVQFIRSIKQ
jgi:GAF domain-containing protein